MSNTIIIALLRKIVKLATAADFVLGEEEYEYNGAVKTRLRVSAVRSVKAIRDGDFTVPEKKCLAPAAAPVPDYEPIGDDGDLPF